MSSFYINTSSFTSHNIHKLSHYVISKPGIYTLTENIVIGDLQYDKEKSILDFDSYCAIQINCSNVILDLNHFSISTTDNYIIKRNFFKLIDCNHHHTITIKNGSLYNTSGYCIYANDCSYLNINDVRLYDYMRTGIHLNQCSNVHIKRCRLLYSKKHTPIPTKYYMLHDLYKSLHRILGDNNLQQYHCCAHKYLDKIKLKTILENYRNKQCDKYITYQDVHDSIVNGIYCNGYNININDIHIHKIYSKPISYNGIGYQNNFIIKDCNKNNFIIKDCNNYIINWDHLYHNGKCECDLYNFIIAKAQLFITTLLLPSHLYNINELHLTHYSECSIPQNNLCYCKKNINIYGEYNYSNCGLYLLNIKKGRISNCNIKDITSYNSKYSQGVYLYNCANLSLKQIYVSKIKAFGGNSIGYFVNNCNYCSTFRCIVRKCISSNIGQHLYNLVSYGTYITPDCSNIHFHKILSYKHYSPLPSILCSVCNHYIKHYHKYHNTIQKIIYHGLSKKDYYKHHHKHTHCHSHHHQH